MEIKSLDKFLQRHFEDGGVVYLINSYHERIYCINMDDVNQGFKDACINERPIVEIKLEK